jgi:ABC-type multidrug transport system permease subunit
MTPREKSPGTTRYHALWQLILARLREFCREPVAVFWVYVFPLIMVVTLGIAFRNRPVEKFEVVVERSDNAAAIITALKADVRFHVKLLDAESARKRLRTGSADLVVSRGEATGNHYEYFYDPTRPGSILARNSADDVLQRDAGRIDVLTATNHEIDEPGSRYIDFLIPGLLGMGLMGGGMWGVGFAIVDLRIRRLLKRYHATPMRRSDFLAAVMLSRLLFTVTEVLLILVFARICFGVVSQGSYLVLGLLILLGSLQFSGIGLLVASRAGTIETVSGLMNLVMLPQWIAAGIFFSPDRFPQVFQPAIQLLPLTPLIQAMRRVMLEGAVLADLGVQIAYIVAWGVVTFALALRWFRWN